MTGKRRSVRHLAAEEAVGGDDVNGSPSKRSKTTKVPKKEKTAKKGKVPTSKIGADMAGEESKKAVAKSAKSPKGKKKKETSSPSPKKKTKKPDHQRWTHRDELPKLWEAEKNKADGSYTFKIMSWNVAGLRALMRNHPNALSDLAKSHEFDVICLQETKLQEIHVDDPKLKIKGHLLEEEGYESYFSCSTAKKGYSGTAVFVRRHNGKKKKKQGTIGGYFGKNEEASNNDTEKQKKTTEDFDASLLTPENVSYKLGKDEHDAEGRIITVDFPRFTLSNLYVPNSGQKLDRLEYRTKEWDTDLLEFMQRKQQDRGVPVVWLGDLNVAHTGMETWNEGAKHLAKSAGTTQEERESFQRQLDAGFVDAFRHLHPSAQGQYTYWSQRAGNREPNKGLRLDYFICSPPLFDETSKAVVRDSWMLHDQVGSDHCPIVLEMEIKK